MAIPEPEFEITALQLITLISEKNFHRKLHETNIEYYNRVKSYCYEYLDIKQL